MSTSVEDAAITVLPGKPVTYRLDAGSGRAHLLLGEVGRLLAGAEESNGAISVMTLCGPAAPRPIPLHWHKAEHDYFYCVRGRMQVWADGHSRILNPGDVASAPPGSVHAYQLLDHYPGGMPIERDGWVVAGIAASGAAIGPFVDYPGVEREQLIADGVPANGEDLLVHYALGIPYEGQHGDDLVRWVAAYGEFPADAGPGRGMAPAPRAAAQAEHGWARALADRALAEAERLGVLITVSIVDQRGDPIEQDRMDGAPAASVAISQASAATAATFQIHSAELADRYSGRGALQLLAAALPFSILPVAGGVPLREGDAVAGGIGVGGPAPHVCQQIAATVTGG